MICIRKKKKKQISITVLTGYPGAHAEKNSLILRAMQFLWNMVALDSEGEVSYNNI